MKKIYVNIASYRDPLLAATLQSMMGNESGRNKIVYGVFEQTKLEDSLIRRQPVYVKSSNVRYKRIDPEYSDGVVWARSINAMQIYDEEFMYQVDSHMLFDKDWDNYLIWDYEQAKKLAGTDKIILTTGTKNFEYFGNVITKHNLEKDITVNFKYFQFAKHLILRTHGKWIESTDTVTPGIHTIAGNFFVPSKWVKDVGYNTNLFFDAEEQYMSISSLLAGYKIYHQRKIKCYHYLDSAKSSTRQDVEPVVDESRRLANLERERRELINYIYSLGEEQLNYYKSLTGVDYINRKLEERAITRTVEPDIPVDWEIESAAENANSGELKEDEQPKSPT
jgi:hypothetical protein